MKAMRTLSALVLFCALGSCKQTDQLQDLHDATMSMNGNTSEVNGTTKDTLGMMTEIYDSGRQGASLELRNKLFLAVVGSKKNEEKLTNAALYFEAFEFELWSNKGPDAKGSRRDLLARDAADEFFGHMLGLSHWPSDAIDPFALGGEKPSFNAFAASIERTNRKQVAVAAEANVKTLSMYSIIETSLLAGQSIRAGNTRVEDYPSYVDIVLRHDELAERVLKARYQMLGLMVLAQVTPIGQDLWKGFQYKIAGQRWKLDLNELNESRLRYYTYLLQNALQSRSLLERLGVPVELDPSIRKIYSHMELVDVREPAASLHAQAAAALKQALAKYQEE